MGVVYLYAGRTIGLMAKETPIMPNRVRELRKRQRLTQEKLAEKCQTTHATIQRIETGKMDLSSYWTITIAGALAVHPGALFAPLPWSDDPAIHRVMEIVASLPPEQLAHWSEVGEGLRMVVASRHVPHEAPAVSTPPVGKPAKRRAS